MSNFYIIGTKYGEHNDIDITPRLWEKKAIAIGFCWFDDLTYFYNSNHDELFKYLKDRNEKDSTINQMKHFLSIKPGDIIALKSHGAPIKVSKYEAYAHLEIIGYAVVVERNGVVYRHEPAEYPHGLGHLINVEFLEKDIKHEFQLAYGRTIHNISKLDRIKSIFGPYAELNLSTPDAKNSNGVTYRNVTESMVSVSASYIKSAIHNYIQLGLFKLFVGLYGVGNVVMEENYVDIIIRQEDCIELVEVKPYTSATLCIREGLGQLLSYYYSHYSNIMNVKLTIIGSNKPNQDDIKFIAFIQDSLNLKFCYDSWERLNAEGKHNKCRCSTF